MAWPIIAVNIDDMNTNNATFDTMFFLYKVLIIISPKGTIAKTTISANFNVGFITVFLYPIM